VITREICTRCGHITGGCPRCGRTTERLGGTVDGLRYCHTDILTKPTCFEVAARAYSDSREATAWPKVARGQLIVCRGLPGSGKTTWAMEWLGNADPGEKVARLNRDAMRRMSRLTFDPVLEGVIASTQHQMAMALLQQGYTVIVDDTNLKPRVFETWRLMAGVAQVALIIKDFTDTPIEVCIKRDAERQGVSRVGEQVIRAMYYEHLQNGEWPCVVT